jgi:anti-sigma B factor antagonist
VKDIAMKKIAFDGALTIYEAAAAKAALLEALQGADGIEVDLSAVSELDTAGAQLLVLAKREADTAGKAFALSGQGAAVREVFDCYGLHVQFEGTR